MTPGALNSALQRLIGVAGLIIAAPLLGAVAFVIRVFMGSPVLFRQRRAGLHGGTFTLLKFRTMDPASPEKRKDEERITPIGRFLRSTSIDELPTLLNVVFGDMVLVGPRPLLPEYTDRYTQDQAVRLQVRPGITGLCQVRGRNALSWREKFELDTWYVQHRSWKLDLRILAATIVTVLGRKGTSHVGHATMPEFLSTEDSPVATEDGGPHAR